MILILLECLFSLVYIYIYILGSDLYILKIVLHEVVCRG